VVILPDPLIILDGSKSTDDRNIVSWQWTREDTSLAAGVSLKYGLLIHYNKIF